VAAALDSLIVNLQDEARMAEWRRDLLARLIKDKSLLVLGYGGRDFELCPELARSVRPRHLVWVDVTRAVTPNAKRVLMEQRCTLVVSDLNSFLVKIFRFDPSGLARGTVRFDLPIDRALIPEWRARLLDWMACGRLALAEIHALPDARTRALLTASAFGHIGRYRDSIRAIEREAGSPTLSRREQLQLQLSAASSWFIFGAHLKGWGRLKAVEQQIIDEGFLDLRSQIMERKLMMAMRLKQLARLTGVPFVVVAIQRLVTRLYETAREALERGGDLGGLQALRINAQRIGLPVAGEMALPAIEGYASLGAIGMLSVAARDAVRTGGPWYLLSNKKQACFWGIKNARRFGWSHEEWKFRWLLLVRGGGPFHLRHLVAWWKAFQRTQYTWTGRLFQIINATMPHN